MVRAALVVTRSGAFSRVVATVKTRYTLSAENIAALKSGALVAKILSSAAVLSAILAFSMGAALTFASRVAEQIAVYVVAIPRVKARRKAVAC